MSDYDLYRRAFRVINSCKTKEQCAVAWEYLYLVEELDIGLDYIQKLYDFMCSKDLEIELTGGE